MMVKILRVFIFVIILGGMIGMAQSQIVGAASPSKQADASPVQISQRLSPQNDRDCDRHRGKCRDRDKDKDKCKKHNKHCGTVKPPPWKTQIPVTGEYSVGGLCTLSVVLNDSKTTLNAELKDPLPHDLPRELQRVQQGCLLTFYSSQKRIPRLSSAAGSATICFAATPKKMMTLYFYDIYSAHPKWTSLETTVRDGKACAAGNGSGVYVATFKRP
jgi:hypothetical protein